VLLHHGFASSSATNWVRPKVAAAITEAGRSVVLIDARGHGESDKPHDPTAYEGDAMARDVSGLFDHLGLESVDVVGYSMGSRVALELAGSEPRVRSLVLGAPGRPSAAGDERERARRIAEGLEAPSRATVTDRTALAFRNFAEATGADLLALAALQRSRQPVPDKEALGRIAVPTLVLNGEDDTLAGAPEWLTEAIPGAQLQFVPGDHISAVVKPEFRQAIVAFLSGTEAGPQGR
jgi:pimeloyl-ACP methyl ester carboxylesterase